MSALPTTFIYIGESPLPGVFLHTKIVKPLEMLFQLMVACCHNGVGAGEIEVDQYTEAKLPRELKRAWLTMVECIGKGHFGEVGCTWAMSHLPALCLLVLLGRCQLPRALLPVDTCLVATYHVPCCQWGVASYRVPCCQLPRALMPVIPRALLPVGRCQLPRALLPVGTVKS